MGVALKQAKSGRIHILDKMSEAIETESEMSEKAPMIESFMVNKVIMQ